MTREEQQAVLAEWLVGRPDIIHTLAAQYPPWEDYRMRETGQRARIKAYSEDGTVRVIAWRDDFPEAMLRLTVCEVFGIDPTTLEVVT